MLLGTELASLSGRGKGCGEAPREGMSETPKDLDKENTIHGHTYSTEEHRTSLKYFPSWRQYSYGMFKSWAQTGNEIGVAMRLDFEKSDRLSRLVAGFHQAANLSWEELVQVLHIGRDLRALIAGVGGNNRAWQFSDACPAAAALSCHYDLPAASVWSYIRRAALLLTQT